MSASVKYLLSIWLLYVNPCDTRVDYERTRPTSLVQLHPLSPSPLSGTMRRCGRFQVLDLEGPIGTKLVELPGVLSPEQWDPKRWVGLPGVPKRSRSPRTLFRPPAPGNRYTGLILIGISFICLPFTHCSYHVLSVSVISMLE